MDRDLQVIRRLRELSEEFKELRSLYAPQRVADNYEQHLASQFAYLDLQMTSLADYMSRRELRQASDYASTHTTYTGESNDSSTDTQPRIVWGL